MIIARITIFLYLRFIELWLRICFTPWDVFDIDILNLNLGETDESCKYSFLLFLNIWVDAPYIENL